MLQSLYLDIIENYDVQDPQQNIGNMLFLPIKIEKINNKLLMHDLIINNRIF